MINDYFDGIRIIKDFKTKEPVGIEWHFDDGTISRYFPEDLSADWFVFFVNDVVEEQSLARKSRRWVPFSLDNLLYDSYSNSNPLDNPVKYFNFIEEREEMLSFMDTLTEAERRRLEIKMDDLDYSFQRIASIEGTSKVAIFKSFKSIKEKYELFKNQGKRKKSVISLYKCDKLEPE